MSIAKEYKPQSRMVVYPNKDNDKIFNILKVEVNGDIEKPVLLEEVIEASKLMSFLDKIKNDIRPNSKGGNGFWVNNSPAQFDRKGQCIKSESYVITPKLPMETTDASAIEVLEAL